MSAASLWRDRVRAHHAQSLKAQGGEERAKDFWSPFVSAFMADPRRANDPVVDRLAREARPEWTVLDVGSGAGRLALPLALRCCHVTAVEPSESMLEALRQGAREASIQNLTAVQGRWEEVEVAPADVVLCAHVLYGVEEVGPFARRLEAHARERVLLLMFNRAPQSPLSPLWKLVHGEERVDLPGLRELLNVLWEMEIYPDLEMFPEAGPRAYESWEGARDEFRRRLYVEPGTETDRRLERAMAELLEERAAGFVVRGAAPLRLGLISWKPA
ncbi:MAG: class I SAM-dependent methyltransferase [Chloroflexi bacterium]|nr:class I SAM-dependent methyltransferase [Chloroflexota bacterium]